MWTGPAGAEWFYEGNWEPNGMPDANDELWVTFGSPKASAEVHAGGGGSITVEGADASATFRDLHVAYEAQGTLRIAGGASVSARDGYIGYLADANGAVYVTGRAPDETASSWTHSGFLCVGYGGLGLLSITGGGQVANTHAYVGFDTAACGTVVVDGDGSRWTSSGDLTLGDWGTGELIVQAGGYASNAYAYLGAGVDGNGSVTVTGTGTDGTSATWRSTKFTRIGEKGVGSLRVLDGGTFTSAGVNIGYEAGARGSVVVDGSGSTWANSGDAYVSDWGTGRLDVTRGGQVTSGYAYIASGADADGAATIDGNGSTWTCRQALYVAHEGLGALTIRSGGRVSNGAGYVGYQGDSNGSVLVEGVSPDGAAATWANSSNLYVARSGVGSLTIRDGGLVVNMDGVIGQNTGSRGSVVVAGAGATWAHLGDLEVGRYGQGEMTVRDGGTVTNFVGYLAYYADGRGEATVEGAGAAWESLSDLYVGRDGRASLAIRGGGWVSSSLGYVGCSRTADAEAAVEGTGPDGNSATWQVTGPLYVGYEGTGRLAIRGGGLVTAQSGDLGYHSNSFGEATVEGDGAVWSQSGCLTVAMDGNAAMTIRDGGRVSNGLGRIAFGYAAEGAVTVEGGGSRWDNAGALYVAQNGLARLWVRDGAAVTCASAYIAAGIDSDAAVSVEGEGSSLAAESELSVGDWSLGVLTIRGGGRVSSGTGYVAYGVDANGLASVEGSGSAWVNAGWLYVGGSDVLPGGPGELSIDGGTVQVGQTLKVWPAGRVHLAAGALDANDVLLTEGGAFRFTGGRLSAAGFRGDLANEGGWTCPGRPSGRLALDGTYTQGPAGGLLIELGECDDGNAADAAGHQLAATGEVMLDGLLRLEWLPVPGEPRSKFGGVYSIVTCPGPVVGRFRDIELGFGQAYFAGIEYDVDVSPDGDAGGKVLAVQVELYDLLDGDADLDGRVDRGDFLALRGGFGAAEANWADGDFDFDGDVDAFDYVVLKRSCGAFVPGPAAIPEPAALLLLSVGTLALMRRKLIRQRHLGRDIRSLPSFQQSAIGF